MTIIEMLEQSGVLALLGMGIVFSFLIILVAAITISSKIIRKYEKPVSAGNAPQQHHTAPLDAPSGVEITAVISAAVNHFRKNN